jgi:phosphoribosylanthranilate isomerase
MALQEKQIQLIKVFSIREAFDFDSLKDYEGHCDYFLFDTKGELPGGNGFAFDWGVLEAYNSNTPFFLSGGIGPEDLDKVQAFLETLAAQKCHAIDVNSKFELEAGRKNPEALERFLSTLKKNTKNSL